IATIRGFFPLHYLRFPFWRELNHMVRRHRGRERGSRDLAVFSRRAGIADAGALFRSDRFIAENGFRPGTPLHFGNHHEAHALSALFFTDWDDALTYTADGVGDNVSYSVRWVRDGELQVLAGGAEWLTRKDAPCNSVATAYGCAT